MIYRLLTTINSFAPTILRLVLAVIFTVHGGQMTVGWLGGAGWNATLAQWTAPAPNGPGVPYGLAALGIVTEACGAVGMLLGFLTRPAALGLLGLIVTATLFGHGRVAFSAPGGYEYPLTLGGVALALSCCGGGKWSVDRFLTRALLPPNSGRLSSYLETMD